MSKPLSGRPVIFGEVLFDVFPDGAILGGAPFNVACHLQGFGANPLFISRIGNDENGETVLEAMRKWDMDTAGLQQDSSHPTGRVDITMDGTSHSFEILADQAYDHIESGAALEAIGDQAALLYHGSLAARQDDGTKQTLAMLREKLAVPVFVDINLRAPWWERESCLDLIKEARWVKLNDEELDELFPGSQNREDRAQIVRGRFDLDTLILTCGETGAYFITDNDVADISPKPVTDLVDSVGAGDAFAAVTIFGLLRGWSAHDTLSRAVEFAAELCRHRGAILHNRGIYETFLSEWKERKAA